MDDATRNRSFGHFACILIDIDLTMKLHDRLIVEREGYAFYVDLEYERLPQFCVVCQTIGHSISNCKANSKKQSFDQEIKDVQVNKEGRKQNLQHVLKNQAVRIEDKGANKKSKMVILRGIIYVC